MKISLKFKPTVEGQFRKPKVQNKKIPKSQRSLVTTKIHITFFSEIILHYGTSVLCQFFHLNIVWNVLSVDRDNDLQISGSGVRRVDREVNRLVDHAASEVGHAHLIK